MNVTDLGPGTVGNTTRLEGIPVSVFVVMCSLSLLGVVYSIALLVFNVAKAGERMIKMTSPNINVVILVGCALGYLAMVSTGVDSKWVSLDAMGSIMQGSVFTVVVCFSLIYGSVFCKCWRVYLIFKNLNFNGKLTRDEHLLLGVVVMVLLDLAVLLPWTLTDPITCERKLLTTVYESTSRQDVSVEIDVCTSSLLPVWLGVLYAYKLLLLLVGLYFTWQTRNVTLPSLQDDKQIYIVVYTVISLGLVALPVLLYDSAGMTIKYASGSLILFIVLTTTVTLLFVPKVLLVRRAKAAAKAAGAAGEDGSGAAQDSFRFLFSESMRRTQDALRRCSLCFCCGGAREDDKYAQEMLATEIDTLKRTIKEKDSTIRELTDRLYFGAEKFQEYLKSPKYHQNVLYAAHRKHMRRTRSHPATEHGGEYQLQALEQEPRRYDDRDMPRDGQYPEDDDYLREQFNSSQDAHNFRHPDSCNSSFRSGRSGRSAISSRSNRAGAVSEDRDMHSNHNVPPPTATHHSNVAYDDDDDSLDDCDVAVDGNRQEVVVVGDSDGRLSRGMVVDVDGINTVVVDSERQTAYASSSSPNNDSAIDNNSPSSDSSDRASDQVLGKESGHEDLNHYHRHHHHHNHTQSPVHNHHRERSPHYNSLNHGTLQRHDAPHYPETHNVPQYPPESHNVPQYPPESHNVPHYSPENHNAPHPHHTPTSTNLHNSPHPSLQNGHQVPHHSPEYHHNVPHHPSENHNALRHSQSDNHADTNSSSRGRFQSIRLNQEEPCHVPYKIPNGQHAEVDAYNSPIDLEAMEYDANLKHWTGDSKRHSESESTRVELEPYRTQRINGMSVSQI